jgi:hypothetical protein
MSVFKIGMLAGLAMWVGSTFAVAQTSPADSTRIKLHGQNEVDDYYKAPPSSENYYEQRINRSQSTVLRRVGVGLTMGWGAAYGNGIEVSYLRTEKMDVNGGIGLNLSGLKAGLGVRYFLSGEKRTSPFVGGGLVRSSGLSEITFENPATGQESVYRLHPSTLAHFRGGLRFKYKSIAWLGTAGYGLTLVGRDHELISGPAYSDGYMMLNVIKAGGVEIAGTLQISF